MLSLLVVIFTTVDIWKWKNVIGTKLNRIFNPYIPLYWVRNNNARQIGTPGWKEI